MLFADDLSERCGFNSMVILEVVVFGSVLLNCVILKVFSQLLSSFTYGWGGILGGTFQYNGVQNNITTNYILTNNHRVKDRMVRLN